MVGVKVGEKGEGGGRISPWFSGMMLGEGDGRGGEG